MSLGNCHSYIQRSEFYIRIILKPMYILAKYTFQSTMYTTYHRRQIYVCAINFFINAVSAPRTLYSHRESSVAIGFLIQSLGWWLWSIIWKKIAFKYIYKLSKLSQSVVKLWGYQFFIANRRSKRVNCVLHTLAL